ncbi:MULTISPECIES: cytochrome c biogenesis CcdA family protein [unclassified Micromonospora]|uniref:cytochrome c biogenesis CcdA family protein n=1 Tax=unclassified Micromonospora TaxID=2617518 RepID=UPI003325B85D
MSIGLAGALIGGVLTLLSPCSVMLLPAFFAYAFTNPTRLVARTAVFYLGLLTTLVPIGVLAGSLGAVINEHRTLLVTVAAGVVIVLGLVQLAGVSLPAFGHTSAGESTSTASVFLLGTVYGMAGVCAGPVLGSVLALAALGGDPLYGGIVLAVFAFGMAVPLFVLAITWSRMPWVRRLVRPRQLRIGRWTNTWTQIVSGALGIGLGVLLVVTDGTASLSGLLGTSQQFTVEARALDGASHVPDLAVVLAALLVLAAAWLVHRRRSAVCEQQASPDQHGGDQRE